MITATKAQTRPPMSKVRILVECALMIAIGTVLAQIKLFRLPNGGSVTAVSMLPFILVSFRHGCRWGVLTGVANAMLQMVFDNVSPAGSLWAFFGMVMLDYLLAFIGLGFADAFARPFGREHRFAGVLSGTVAVCIIRFLCSFVSGFLIWGDFAPEGMSPVLYSLGYQASYMVPETIITVVAAVLLFKAVPKIFNREI